MFAVRAGAAKSSREPWRHCARRGLEPRAELVDPQGPQDLAASTNSATSAQGKSVASAYVAPMKALCETAVEAALAAGASYADARAVLTRRQHVVTKNGQVDDLSDGESEGIGVRVLVDGAWGFAGDRRLDEAGARDAAARASAFARAAPSRDGRQLAPIEPAAGPVRDAVRARPVRRPALGEDRPLPARRGGHAAAADQGHAGDGSRPARGEGARLLRGQLDRAGARRVRRRASTRTPPRATSSRSGAIRASTRAPAARAAGSTSSRSASTARRRASASRPSRS